MTPTLKDPCQGCGDEPCQYTHHFEAGSLYEPPYCWSVEAKWPNITLPPYKAPEPPLRGLFGHFDLEVAGVLHQMAMDLPFPH